MKTIGEQAKEYREARGWSVKEMAAACGTSRQNIETLEAKGSRTPRYVKDLARVMGTTVDTLLEGRYVLGAPQQGAVSAPPSNSEMVPADELLMAITVLGKAINNADRITRLSVEPLLAELAREPANSGKISHMLHKLLKTDVSPNSVREDVGPGRRSLKEALDSSKSMGPDGRRDSIQQQGGRK